MPTIDAGGITLHYERRGAGPPLLLLAGLASDSASWAPVTDALAARFDLILPDNRCAGRTRPLPCPVSRELMLGDIARLLDALGLRRVGLFGHSMGGMLALHFAARHPAHAAAVLAMSTTGAASAMARQGLADLGAIYGAPGVPDRLWFRLLYQWLFRPDFFADPAAVAAAAEASASYAHRQPPAAFRAQVAALADFAAPPDLSGLACPAMALTGALDLMAGPAAVRASLPGLPLTVIEGAAHALHWEAPAAVTAAATAFFTA
jgi:pimeloyl-ACP methyl ester carboxylesterase